MKYTHYWYYKKYMPERKGQPCRILARGKGCIKNVLVEFEDGFKVVSTRFCARKRKPNAY
jgi:hypothetical protein